MGTIVLNLELSKMSGANQRGHTGAQQLLPRHRYMLQKVDAAFGIYDENSTEAMFLQSGVIDKVSHQHVGYSQYTCSLVATTTWAHRRYGATWAAPTSSVYSTAARRVTV